MSYQFRKWYIRDEMIEAIGRYVDHGIGPGDFLCAVICNNLREAIGCADDENLDNLPAFVAYFHNEVPGPCWGSTLKMTEWIRLHEENRSKRP